MTTEQKFKQLLNLAINNGFDIDKLQLNEKNCLRNYKTINNLFIFTEYPFSLSFNDLVFKTNFFECLFKGWSLFTFDYNDTLIELRVDYINSDGVLNIGKDSLELSCHKNTAVQFKKIQWLLEVERGTALQWLFKQFNLQ